MATRIFTIVDKERYVGHVSTYNRNVAINEGLRLFGNLECFMVVESWLVDEWVDLNQPWRWDGDAE